MDDRIDGGANGAYGVPITGELGTLSYVVPGVPHVDARTVLAMILLCIPLVRPEKDPDTLAQVAPLSIEYWMV